MASAAWTCTACGTRNPDGELCATCGVTRRYSEDPPLDLPYPPRWRDLPSTYAAALWAVLALVGAALLSLPAWRSALGLPPAFVALELASAAAAAATAAANAWWERHFNEMTLEVPKTVRTGEPFDAALRLVPYDAVRDVRVRFRLRDNFYQRSGEGGVETRSRTLDTQLALLGERLTGRRLHEPRARFLAPFPATRHTDVVAEALASLYGALSWLVPGLGLAARNLREHGGYYVEATVRVGWMRRTFKRRVVAFHLADELFVG